MLEFARAWNLHQTMTDAVREGARRAVLADTWPVDSVYAPMWRYLEQAGYNPSYATDGRLQRYPAELRLDFAAGSRSDFKSLGKPMTVTLSVPYRIWVLGNRSITMKSSLTVRNE